MNDIESKKRKRGNRGGANKKVIEEISSTANHSNASTENSANHSNASTENSAIHGAHAETDTWIIDRSGNPQNQVIENKNLKMNDADAINEKKQKKTRRGGQSKKKEDLIHENNHQHGISHDDTILEHTAIDFIGGVEEKSIHEKTGLIRSANDLFLDPESHSYFMALEPILDKIAKDFKVNRKNTDQEEAMDELQEYQLLLENLFERELGDFTSHDKLAILCDFGTSRVLQKLLDCPLVTHDQIRSFATLLANAKGDDAFFSSLVSHQFGSHVFQTLLEKSGSIIEAEVISGDYMEKSLDSDTLLDDHGNNDHISNHLEGEHHDNGNSDENLDLSKTSTDSTKSKQATLSMQEYIKVFAERCMPKWCDFMTHVHGTHILRSLLNLLAGGAYLDKQTSRSKKSRDYNMNHDLSFKTNRTNAGGKRFFLVPSSFSTLLTDISNTIISHLSVLEGGIRSMSTHSLANPVLQLLLSIPQCRTQVLMALFPSSSLKNSPDCLAFIDKIVYDTVGSHLMEKILAKPEKSFMSTFDSKLLRSLFKNYFQSRILELCDHPLSNFVLQALLPSLEKEEHVKSIMDTLLPRLYDLVFGRHGNRMGVLVRIVEVSVSWPSLQASVCQALEEAFGVPMNDSSVESEVELEKKRLMLAPLILHVRTFQQYEERVFVHRPHTLGSLLLQHLLKFSHPHNTLISKSIASLSIPDLLLWCRDATCSPIIEHFLHSPSTSTKLKHHFVSLVKENVKVLAIDKFGSHVLDTIFTFSNLETREWICHELLDAIHSPSNTGIQSSFHAGFVIRNCQVDLFKRRKDEWMVYQRAQIKERKKEKGGKKEEDGIEVKEEKKKKGDKKKDEIDLIFINK